MEKLRNGSMLTNDSDMSLPLLMNSLSGIITDLMVVWILKNLKSPELAFWRRLPQGAILGIGIRVFGW